MRLLLDTHIVLWAAFEPQRLPPDVAVMFDDATVRCAFSVVSLWEIAIKAGRGRPDFAVVPQELRWGLLESDYDELDVTGPHVLGVTSLPAIHGDPFDRLLVAQAIHEGMTLLTSDKKVAAYPGPIRLVQPV